MNPRQLAEKLRELATEVDSSEARPLEFGEIIAKLKSLVSRGVGKAYITFDWGCAWPTGFDSYRGDYAQICMEYGGEHRHHQTVEGLLKQMEELIGKTLTGWKGGDYTVHGSKEVYVCCAGCTSCTRVVDITHDEDQYSSAIIHTHTIPE